jgi:hypothetical protein
MLLYATLAIKPLVNKFQRSVLTNSIISNFGLAYLFIVMTSKEFVMPLPIAPAKKDENILIENFFLSNSSSLYFFL